MGNRNHTHLLGLSENELAKYLEMEKMKWKISDRLKIYFVFTYVAELSEVNKQKVVPSYSNNSKGGGNHEGGGRCTPVSPPCVISRIKNQY